MPVLNASTAPALYDLATRLSADLNKGAASRQSFGAQDAAFGWAANNLPRIIATYVSNAESESTSFGALVIKDSPTKAAKVAGGAAKPNAVSLASSTVNLPKYAGMAEWQLEQHVKTDGLVFAAYSVIAGQCMLAFDADVVAALDAATTPMTSVATWAGSVLGGIAAVVSAGGSPDLLVISPADYAAAVTPGAGYVASPTEPTQTLYGLRICMSAGVATGTAYVLDSAAVTCVELAGGPVAILDPYTKADINVIRLVIDLFAGVVVNAPGLVAAIAKT